MKERRNVIILTQRRTLVERWVEKKDATTLCVKVDENAYPHLRNLDESEVMDVSVEHNYGERYTREVPFAPALTEN